jgi:membrane protease YdiL (CAAX protease family)
VFYGGITEEILMRWGVMTLTVWLLSKVITGKTGQIQPACFILGIVLSSLLFAAGHLPLVSILTDNITAPLLAYILIANSLFGLVAGYLYWKQGLEAAVIAHIVAHLVMYSVAG